MDTLDFF